MILGGLDVSAQQDECRIFSLHCDHVWSFIKSATNVPVLNFYNSVSFL